MKYRSIANHFKADEIMMGHLAVKQPIPSAALEQASPFLLLHHFGPFTVEPGVDPMDIGGHPHRGFEPVTFMFQGEVEHHDSRGNHGIVAPGGVQWMTAGRGIIHSERASKRFVEKGGTFEGIQLWVNLRSADKMADPGYQDFAAADLPVIEGEKWSLRVVSGTYLGTSGPVKTKSPVNTAMLHFQPGARLDIDLEENHHSMIYFLEGSASINGKTTVTAHDFVRFDHSGEGFNLEATEVGKALVLSGEMIDEPVASYGPFVMNNQTEIMQAMRDYQMGKMGVLVED